MDLLTSAVTMLGAQNDARAQIVAAKILKQTAGQEKAMANLLDAAAQNLDRVASAAPGMGGLVDITV
jgi:hypothetical protein